MQLLHLIIKSDPCSHCRLWWIFWVFFLNYWLQAFEMSSYDEIYFFKKIEMFFNISNGLIQGSIISTFSSAPPCKCVNARFTTVPLNLCLIVWVRGPSPAVRTGRALRLGQTWEIAHLESCHLGKYLISIIHL